MDLEQLHRTQAQTHRDSAKRARDMIPQLQSQMQVDIDALTRQATTLDANEDSEAGAAQSFRDQAERKRVELQGQIDQATKTAQEQDAAAAREDQEAERARRDKESEQKRLSDAARAAGTML